LSTPFVNLALMPEVASSMLLPARIGHVRAFSLFAVGEVLSAAEAFALGLANRVLPKDEVLPRRAKRRTRWQGGRSERSSRPRS
jgi:enoyl-CoA hydratase/carnithine racemase